MTAKLFVCILIYVVSFLAVSVFIDHWHDSGKGGDPV